MSKKTKPLCALISEDRILQLDNDLAENIKSGTVEEWRTVARYFHDENERLCNKLSAIRPSIAALITGSELLRLGQTELAAWLDKQTANDP